MKNNSHSIGLRGIKKTSGMDQETKQELREIVASSSMVIMTTVESQNRIINSKLDSINDHLAKINGRVNKHDEQINAALMEREKNREEQREHFKDLEDLKPKVRVLEDQQLSSITIKKWLVGSIAVVGVLVGIILSVMQIMSGGTTQ